MSPSSFLFSWILAVLAAVFAAPRSAAAKAAAREGQTLPAISESAEGLQSQIEAILSAAMDHDQKHYEDLISTLKIPEGANWFSVAFGEEASAKISATYGKSWETYKDQIARIFRDTGKARLKHVFVKGFSVSSLPTQDNFLRAVLENVRDSEIFYTAGAGKNREMTTLPGVYVYVQGAFRILNWGAFYGLPNVKSMRIRVETSVAMSQLLHQVNPTLSAEAHKEGLQGTVVLHIVIDRDGNISQLQPISGSDLLVKDAMEAVRQWRFRPTLLNGDPVEVDSTVNIVFSKN